MNRILLMLALLLSPCFLFAQVVSFSFTPGYDVPAENSIVKDTFIRVIVAVYTPGPVATVTAAAGGHQATLAPYGAPNKFIGSLSLAGLPGDTLSLVLAATDSLGNTGDTAITFIYRPLVDPAVSLTIDSLADQSVARPFLALGARSVGNTIQVYSQGVYNEQLIFTAEDSIPVLDLSAYDGKRLKLKLVATDSIGRTTQVLLSTFVESSRFLTPVLNSHETIVDVRYGKALVTDKTTGYPVLVDLASGQRSAPLINADFSTRSYVTKNGAALTSEGLVYEWSNGQIVFQSRGDDLKAAGDYIAWIRPGSDKSDTIIRKNLATGVKDSAALLNYRGDIDLGPNGIAVYSIQNATYQSNIFRYDNGKSNALSPSISNSFKNTPLTDGFDVVYSVNSHYDGDRSVYYYNRKSNTDVQLLDTGLDPYTGYQLNNGYMAFVRGQVALRDSTGNLRNVTSLPVGSVKIDLLNDKGQLMVTTPDSGRFYVQSSGVMKKVGSLTVTDTWGPVSRSFYDNGVWYLLVGKTLFKVNVDGNDSTVVVPQPVVTGLSSSYCAAADSQKLKIANLPAAGSGITVEVLLDSTRVLPVAADSTFTINPAVLSVGRHNISVTFSYDTIQKQLPLSFMVTAAVTPSLDVSVNVNPITTDSIPVIITATNVTGGGKQPLYTFAWDRNFINQLQLESNSNSVTVAAAEFELGDNVVYARVRTSDQCYTSQTGIDSITINKTNITAVVDVDNPNKPVIIYPNPFRDQISVNGLLSTKVYILSLYDLQGKLLLHQRVVNQAKAVIIPPAGTNGIYILRVYDEKAKRILGAQKLVGY